MLKSFYKPARSTTRKQTSGRQVIPKETNQQTDSKKPNEGEDPHEHMLVSLEKRMVKEINGDYYDER